MDEPACTTPAQARSSATSIPVGWARSAAPTGYLEAVAAMESHVAAIAEGKASELVWLTEHPPLYTAGTSAKATDLITPDRFPVFQTGRGGQYTYHGPKQRVVYVMLDVRRRAGDVRAFVLALERWTIAALGRLGVHGETRCGRVGVWVSRTNLNDGQEDKVAAIGIRLRRWISFHGIAINVDPDLTHFDGIVPCGIREHGVTSLTQLTGRDGDALADELDAALRATFEESFGPLLEAPAPI